MIDKSGFVSRYTSKSIEPICLFSLSFKTKASREKLPLQQSRIVREFLIHYGEKFKLDQSTDTDCIYAFLPNHLK